MPPSPAATDLPADDLRRAAVEPLFAHNARLWLRVWAATQATAMSVASYVVVAAAGGPAAFLRSPIASRAIPLLAMLAVYLVVGVWQHTWMLCRTWAVLVFVPVGLALVFGLMAVKGPFGLLLLGAILQGFIFLPFSWAAATLAAVTIGLAAAVARSMPTDGAGMALERVVGIVATGVMIGTVLLYIHRSNREAILRTRMLRQLDEAQHDLADRAREAGVYEERQRFARDIHDTLAQGFTSVIKHLEAIELSLDAGAHREGSLKNVMPHLAHAQDVSRSSLSDIRRLVWALRPAELSEAPLAAALARIVATWSEANGIAASFTSDTLPPLQPDADVIFLRATQESLSNVARHAHAKHVVVSLTCVDRLALLTIEDDGCGFAHADGASAEKMGLSGMRERVRRFGGHLLIESAAGAGTSLTVAMPLSSIAILDPKA